MAEKIRSFIAIDIDEPRLVRKVEEVKNELFKAQANVKWVDAENLHLTLKFLGDIMPVQIDSIFSVMQTVRFEPFDLHISTLGCFPKIDRPRVIWLGVKEGARELKNIFSELDPKLQKIGFKPEKREFSVHLTIGRVKSNKGVSRLAKEVSSLRDVDIGIQRVNSLHLKKSTLTPKGPIYTNLYTIYAI